MADKQPPKTKKYFRPTKQGAGMTQAGVARYRKENPGSKLKTAVTGKVKPGRKSWFEVKDAVTGKVKPGSKDQEKKIFLC
jgi:hypothetical protein